jgi:hypothetical protein
MAAEDNNLLRILEVTLSYARRRGEKLGAGDGEMRYRLDTGQEYLVMNMRGLTGFWYKSSLFTSALPSSSRQM